MFNKIGILKNFSRFTGEHLCWTLFLNKVGEFQPGALSKKRFQHRCFPMNFVKVLRIPFLLNNSGQPVLCDIKKNQFAYILRYKKYFYNLWYCKISVKKRSFTCNFTKLLKDRHFTVG